MNNEEKKLNCEESLGLISKAMATEVVSEKVVTDTPVLIIKKKAQKEKKIEFKIDMLTIRRAMKVILNPNLSAVLFVSKAREKLEPKEELHVYPNKLDIILRSINGKKIVRFVPHTETFLEQVRGGQFMIIPTSLDILQFYAQKLLEISTKVGKYEMRIIEKS